MMPPFSYSLPGDDEVEVVWENHLGELVSATFTVDELAAAERGEPVARYGRPENRYPLADRLRDLRDRQGQLIHEMDLLRANYPHIYDPDDDQWS